MAIVIRVIMKHKRILTYILHNTALGLYYKPNAAQLLKRLSFVLLIFYCLAIIVAANVFIARVVFVRLQIYAIRSKTMRG